ncbi:MULTISPECIES: hypothetical protein [unclassified Burkholderia]|uniref:hypothetical protein n=1 Tax=unclassified Burkholderia TaxID=2613784 RepID=UPI0015D07665|nr:MULTISPECIES: hypothetical protein [unclassified Burkholderia]
MPAILAIVIPDAFGKAMAKVLRFAVRPPHGPAFGRKAAIAVPRAGLSAAGWSSSTGQVSILLSKAGSRFSYRIKEQIDDEITCNP